MTRSTARARCGATSSAKVETPIGRPLIAREIEDGSTVTLDAVDGALHFDWGQAAESAEPVGAAA